MENFQSVTRETQVPESVVNHLQTMPGHVRRRFEAALRKHGSRRRLTMMEQLLVMEFCASYMSHSALLGCAARNEVIPQLKALYESSKSSDSMPEGMRKRVGWAWDRALTKLNESPKIPEAEAATAE